MCMLFLKESFCEKVSRYLSFVISFESFLTI